MAELLVQETADCLSENQVTFAERRRQLEHEANVEAQQLERERKSTYKDFAQLNRANISHIISACGANPQAVRVLLFILEHMDKYNALVCSYKVFEEQLEISHATVARAVTYLKQTGFIVVYRSGSSNVYVMNDNLAWTNAGNKHQYCRFPANVVLTASEQSTIQKDRKAKYIATKIMEESKKGEEET